MSRPCSVCSSPRIIDISADIAAGMIDKEISRRYSLSKSSVQRHRQHIAAPNSTVIVERKGAAFAALAALPTREEVGSALSGIAVRADAITATAESEGSLAVALVGLREIRSTIEAQAKLAGLVGSGGATVAVQNNINIDAAAVVRELIAALRPPPDPVIPAELAGYFADAPPGADTIRRLEEVADADD
jgi:hypothetical protein